jgi:hypothetical protein
MDIIVSKGFPRFLKKKSGQISYDGETGRWDVLVEGEYVASAKDKRLAEYIFKKHTGVETAPFAREEVMEYEEKLKEVTG